MTTARQKINSERLLQQNADAYKENHAMEPYFALTQAGAKALKEYLIERKVEPFPINHSDDEKISDGIPTNILGDFLVEKMKIGIPKEYLNTQVVSKLLGIASVGVHLEDKNNMVHIDPVALDYLARPARRR
jgi:hypothetical protein